MAFKTHIVMTFDLKLSPRITMILYNNLYLLNIFYEKDNFPANYNVVDLDRATICNV